MNLINVKVEHSVYGEGTIVRQETDKILVEFDSKTTKFKFPDSINVHLEIIDKAIKQAFDNEMADITAKKEAVEKAEKEAKRNAEIAKLTEQKKNTLKKSINREYTPSVRINGRAMTYIVFQGSTFDEEAKGQFIWAPKYAKDGSTFHHWDKLIDVRKGDVILHCCKGYIVAISEAMDSYEECKRPSKNTIDVDWTQWEENGRKIKCEYKILENPIKHGNYKDVIAQYCNVKYAPFDKNGNGNMGYLFDINENLASFFVKKIAENNPEIIDLEYIKFLLE